MGSCWGLINVASSCWGLVKYSGFLLGIGKCSEYLLETKAASSQQFPESVFCLCQFVKYNKGYDMRRDNKKRGGAIDYSLRLRLGHLQTVYLGKFYWELKVRSVCVCVRARVCVCAFNQAKQFLFVRCPAGDI